ncbi:ATP-binding protein [Fibrobacterota bacterium]
MPALAKKKTSKKKPAVTGKLRIGDQWNAISIIARSQTNILKAVCELVENSIDANGKNIQIVRKRKDKFVYLEFFDDGDGIKLNEERLPDFKYVATHICDSLKRYLSVEEKSGIHGEFGIGLLGFWSLGKELHLFSKGGDDKAYEMVMKAGKQSFKVFPSRLDMLGYGVRIIIGPLHQTTKGILSGERMQKYLAVELRDRLKKLKVNLSIYDKVARKKLKVIPQKYSGERIKEISRLCTRHGEIALELYYSVKKEDMNTHITLSKDGTRVKNSIADLEHFDHEPWTSGFFEGIIDCPFINLTPGTRDAIINDEKYSAFVDTLSDIENRLIGLMEERKRAEEEKASQAILKDVKRAFVEALNNLPQNEYIWFDVEKDLSGKSAGSGQDAVSAARLRKKPEAIPSFLDELPGDPAVVRISPKVCTLHIGETKSLLAKVNDDQNREVTDHLEYHWEIVEGGGKVCDIEEDKCVYRAPSQATKCVIQARVTYGKLKLEGTCKINVTEEEMEEGVTHTIGQGLPSYQLIPAHGEHWRSQYRLKKNIIEVNSGHRDFLATKTRLTSHKRYIAKLYAKEIVMLNFPNVNQNDSLERIIELLVSIEKLL